MPVQKQQKNLNDPLHPKSFEKSAAFSRQCYSAKCYSGQAEGFEQQVTNATSLLVWNVGHVPLKKRAFFGVFLLPKQGHGAMTWSICYSNFTSRTCN